MLPRKWFAWQALSRPGAALGRTVAALWAALGLELVGQRRYREDCKDDQPAEPLYRRRLRVGPDARA